MVPEGQIGIIDAAQDFMLDSKISEFSIFRDKFEGRRHMWRRNRNLKGKEQKFDLGYVNFRISGGYPCDGDK